MRSDRDQAKLDQGSAGDGKPIQDAWAGLQASRASRRSFLKNAAMATGASAALATGSSALAAGNPNVASLPFQNDPNWVKNHFQNIISDEVTHLETLQKLLGSLNRPIPTFQNLAVANLTQYITVGQLFCSTGAGAYLGAAPYIQNSNILTAAGSLGQVESAQASWLNTLLDQPFLTGGSPFAPPLTIQQVMDRVAPYLVSLNGGPPALFSTNDPSPENDSAIVNFAIILEYLEVEFYTTNFNTIFA